MLYTNISIKILQGNEIFNTEYLSHTNCYGTTLPRHPFARGFGGMLPRENFLKWCNLVRFEEYFAKIFLKK